MNSETKHERLGKDDELKVATSATLMTTPDHLKPAYQKPFRPAACHPSRPIYGAGPWCRRCKDLLRWQGERGRAKVLADVETNYAGSEELKAEFVSEAKRKLDAIREYAPRRKKSEDADSRSIRTSNPKVAEHAAKVLIVKNLDGESAAKELKPDLSPADQAILGRKLETDPHVHREVEKQLTPRGLSDHDRDYFVRRLWEMFESSDLRQEQKALSAMRILGKAFITEKVENTQVEMLKIAGVSEGMERMLGGAESEAQSGFSPFDEVRAELNMKDETFDE